MKHTIEATVLRIEFITPSGKAAAMNYPLYPWDNLKEVKSAMRKAAKEAGEKISRMYKTKKQIENPLLKD